MNPTPCETSTKSDAWRAYRRAFEEFGQKVRQVQLLTTHPNPDRAAIDLALLELEQARVEHNGRRDALVQELLPLPARAHFPAVSSDSPQAYADHVKAIAELLWEGSGRPTGTAEDDWYRAEEIIRRAAHRN